MKLKIGESEVDLDPKHLEVNEENLNEHLKTFAGTYSYYNAMLSKAQFIQFLTEDKYEQTYSERFQYYKDNEAGSDKRAEAKTTINDNVIKAKRAVREAKYISQLTLGYVRALEKAHENALNLGYNIRKEIGSIYPQVIRESGIPADIEKQAEQLFKEMDG